MYHRQSVNFNKQRYYLTISIFIFVNHKSKKKVFARKHKIGTIKYFFINFGSYELFKLILKIKKSIEFKKSLNKLIIN